MTIAKRAKHPEVSPGCHDSIDYFDGRIVPSCPCLMCRMLTTCRVDSYLWTAMYMNKYKNSQGRRMYDIYRAARTSMPCLLPRRCVFLALRYAPFPNETVINLLSEVLYVHIYILYMKGMIRRGLFWTGFHDHIIITGLVEKAVFMRKGILWLKGFLFFKIILSISYDRHV